MLDIVEKQIDEIPQELKLQMKRMAQIQQQMDELRATIRRVSTNDKTLTGAGVAIMMTVENNDNYTELRFSPHAVSFMTNDVILQRYVEIDSQLRRVMTVVKTRSRRHPSDLRLYEITDQGIVVGNRLLDYQGIIGGVPRRQSREASPAYAGLTDPEARLLAALIELREAGERELADRAGLPRDAVARALSRLVEFDYATKVREDDRTIYRPRADQPRLK